MDMQSLWNHYRINRSIDMRNQLILAYAPLVRRVVKMMPSSYLGYVDEDDMISDGMFGLLDAIDKFDTARNVKFETYASTRIRGAIIDKMRKMDVLSRHTRTTFKLIEQSTDELEKSLGRFPTNEEIAEHAGISEKVVRKTMEEAAITNMMSLEEVLQTNACGVENLEGSDLPEEEYQRKETKARLVHAINTLGEKEKQIIGLYYYDEMTLREIGMILDLSESRVSQILSKTLFELRKKLA